MRYGIDAAIFSAQIVFLVFFMPTVDNGWRSKFERPLASSLERTQLSKNGRFGSTVAIR